MNWINVLVVLALTTFATMFATSNAETISVHLLGLSSDPVPLYVPIFAAFLIGFSGGLAALSFSRRKHKQEINQLRHENQMLSQEVENLRNIPLQDDL